MFALMRNCPKYRRKNDPTSIESNPARTMDCTKSEWLSDISATGTTRYQRQQAAGRFISPARASQIQELSET